MSDLDKFEEAYEEFGKLTAGVDTMAFDRHLAGNKSDDVPGLSLEGGLGGRTCYAPDAIEQTSTSGR